MNDYLKILTLEKQILIQSKYSNWANWIEQDIEDWNTNQTTNHHRSAFGGMGSINDLYVGKNDKIGAWNEELFQLLKSMSWTFATKRKIEYPKINFKQIEGMICRKCEYSEVSDYSLNNFLAKRNLPDLIKKWLPTSNFEILIKTEEIINDPIIINESEKLKIALTKSKIIQKPFYTVYPKCPKCNAENSCVYRWEVFYEDNEFRINKSSNNLKLEKEVEKKENRSWIKKILGCS